MLRHKRNIQLRRHLSSDFYHIQHISFSPIALHTYHNLLSVLYQPTKRIYIQYVCKQICNKQCHTQKCYRVYSKCRFSMYSFVCMGTSTSRSDIIKLCVRWLGFGFGRILFATQTSQKYGNRIAFQFQINEQCRIGVAAIIIVVVVVCKSRVKESIQISISTFAHTHLDMLRVQVNLFSFQKAYFPYILINSFVSCLCQRTREICIYYFCYSLFHVPTLILSFELQLVITMHITLFKS